MSYKKTVRNIEMVINRICVQIRKSREPTSGEKLKHLSSLVRGYNNLRIENISQAEFNHYEDNICASVDEKIFDRYGLLKNINNDEIQEE